MVIVSEGNCLEMGTRKLLMVIEMFDMLIKAYIFVGSNRTVCLKIYGFLYTEVLIKTE